MLFGSDTTLLLIISFLVFSLGSFILYKDYKSRINRSFAFLAFSVLGWIISAYFEDEVTKESLRYLLLKFDFIFGMFFAVSLFIFCLDIAKIKIIQNTFIRIFILFIPIFFSFLLLFTGYVVSGYVIDSSGIIVPQFGFLVPVYNFFVIIAPIIGIGLLIWRYRAVKDNEKSQYVYLLIGIFVTVLISLVTNIIFVDYIANSPEYEIYYRLGIFSSVFIVLFPGYSMLRYRLLDMKVVATEVLSFFILLITFIQIFFSEDGYQLILRGVTFIVMFILLGMLVKFVDREISRKEELQEMATRLTITNEELKRLDNSKSEFISIASHQLRTPLTAIKGFLSLILEGSYGKVSPQIEDVVNKVYAANNHLVELVENLLNISRIDSGRIQYQFEMTDLAKIVRDLEDSMTIIAKDRGLRLVFSYPQPPIEPFLLDSQKIREVLSNIIDNAIKYTPEGQVSVSLEQANSIVRVTVVDTGMGIAPMDMEQLFQKFRRGDGAGKVNVSGTGLGLYVGRAFVDAHGGRILVHSDGLGKGSRFIVELPFRKE